jgi:hypothetical protein
MSKKIKLLVILSILGIVFLIGRYSLLILIEGKLETISNYYGKVSSTGTDVLIANQRGDGSEQLVKNLPIEIRRDFEVLFNYLKIYSGYQSRVYIYISKLEKIGTVIKVETTKEWRSSIFFYCHVDWLFSTNEKYLFELIESGKFVSVHGNILAFVAVGEN